MDADELAYFPCGVEATLAAYAAQRQPVILAEGWDMFSETFPTTDGQIYEQVRRGMPNHPIYSKPVLFQPSLVEEMNFDGGAHRANALLKNGSHLDMTRMVSQTPRTLLLHYKWLGPVELLTNRLRLRRRRLSAENLRRHWGSYEDPLVQARTTRARLQFKQSEVIPALAVPLRPYTVAILSRQIENVVRCVAAMRRQQGPTLDIVVLADRISEADRARVQGVRWITGPEPFTFAVNANLALSAAGRNDVLLCNDDAFLSSRGGFGALQQASRDWAAVSAVVHGRSSLPLQKLDRRGCVEEPERFPFICVYLPRRTLETIGPFDELYEGGMWEDNDYCYRIKRAGGRLGICGECVVDHDAANCSFAKQPEYQQLLDVNAQRYLAKWSGVPVPSAATAVSVAPAPEPKAIRTFTVRGGQLIPAAP
jgi:GT2 family glycosyltransferase